MALYDRRRKLMNLSIRCPECGAPTMERTGHQGGFLGCSRFPICVGTRPQGPGVDSYTKLLREAWRRAVVFLSSPARMGPTAAYPWLVAQAKNEGVGIIEASLFSIEDEPNANLERAIDAACEYAGNIDFLVLAHEERYARTRARLKYMTTLAQIREMPKAEFTRRYDNSDLRQLEAMFGVEQELTVRDCLRCGRLAHLVAPPAEERPPIDWTSVFAQLSSKDAEAVPDPVIEAEPPTKWECTFCGTFTVAKDKRGQEKFEYELPPDDEVT